MRLPRLARRAAGLVAASVLASCGSDGGTGPTNGLGAGFTVIARPGTTDTVSARTLQALVVQVRGTDGRPAPSGMLVTIRVSAPRDTTRRNEAGLALCALDTPICDPPVPYGFYSGASFTRWDTTDARGRVKLQVRYGTVAGDAYVRMAVEDYGIRDSIPFTVNVGGLARVRIRVRDTVVTIGARVTELAAAEDRFGNTRSEIPTFSAGAGAPVDVDEGGVVSARAFGRGAVVARYGTLADTSYVSVAPAGRIVVYTTQGFLGLVTVNLDGSGRRETIATGGAFQPLPSRSPDHATILYTDRDPTNVTSSVYTADSSGANKRLVLGSGIIGARFSADGSSIYFGRLYENGILWKARADGSEAVRFFTDTTRLPYFPDLEVSPDGTRAVTPSSTVVTFATRDDRDLFAKIGWIGNVRWSADGSAFYYLSAESGASPVWVVNADGSGRRTVSPAGRVYSYFDLSPDGQWIVARGATGALEVIRVSDRAFITLKLGDVYQPAWR
jgi:hypothetical protein